MTQTIELVALDKLKENPLNPKNHNENLLNKSLSTFGYVDPIVVDERTGLMISGHGRKQALETMQLNGEKAPEGITVKNNQWFIPVVKGWASKNDDEANAALIALNRTTEQGGWDRTNLLAILQELSDTDLLETIGFVDSDVAILEKAVEAEGVFTMDISNAIDEFIDETNIEEDRIEVLYSSVLKVYFQTPEARQDFFDAIGYKNEEKQLTIRYPATFQKQAAEKWNG